MIRNNISTLSRGAGIYKTLKGFILFTLIIFSILHQNVTAQDDNPEEILVKIESYKKKDTVLYNLYMDLAKAVGKENHEQARLHINKALRVANQLNYAKGQGDAYYELGRIFSNTSKFDSARIYSYKALDAYKTNKLVKKYASCYNIVGVTYYHQGEYDKALKSYRKSAELDKKYSNLDDIDCLSNIGIIYGIRAQHDKAIAQFNKVIRIQLNSDDQSEINSAYNNLGVIYSSKGDWIKALEYYQKANRIERKYSNEIDMIMSYLNIGRIYMNQEELDKALDYFNKSLKLARKYDAEMEISWLLSHIGVIEKKKKNYTKAIKLHKESLQIGEKLSAQQTISFSLLNLGDVFIEMDSADRALEYLFRVEEICLALGNPAYLEDSYKGIATALILKKKWNEALEYALKGIELANKYEHIASQVNLNRILSTIYEEKGNIGKAYFHFKEHTKFQDSLYNEENTRKIAQLEYKHMYADSLELSAQRELILSNRVKQADLDSAKSKQFILWLIIGLLSVILIAVATIAYLRFRNIKTKFKNIAIEQKLLRTQMTPHFLFNSMGIIQGMILNGAYKKSLDYLSDFSKLLRLTLENSRNKTVSLEKELEAINSYIALQNNTSRKPYNCEIHLDSSTDPKKVYLPPMLIQPFVENAIEHGFKEEMDNKNIDITIQFNDEDLICVITDNGIGINQTISKKTETKTSMATQITKDRLKLLAAEFKVRTGFSIKDRAIYSEQGTVVNLILPHKRIVNG